jgi:hypothetical protein
MGEGSYLAVNQLLQKSQRKYGIGAVEQRGLRLWAAAARDTLSVHDLAVWR